MKKIGIYLQSGPTCGGTYQYNQLIVDALASIKQYQAFAVYSAPHWEAYLNGKMPGMYVPRSRFWELTIGLWRRLKLPVSLFRKTLGKMHPLYKAFIKNKCDVWIFPSQDPFYWFDINAIGVVHDLMHRFEKQFEEVGNQREYNRREFHYQHTSQYAQMIFVDSQLGKQHLESSYRPAVSKGKVLPYIAARDIAYRKSSNTFNSDYSLPAKYLFYPAQFWRHKNHIRLLEALSLVRQECSDIQLVLVGSPKNGFETVKQCIHQLKLQDCVHIFGYVDESDLPEFYRRARALIMPTFFGPTNIPPLEAFALNCPVVISGIYGMKDQLGDAALFIDPNSVEDMAQKIKQVWLDDDLTQSLIAKGKGHHQNWNFEGFKKQFKALLQDL